MSVGRTHATRAGLLCAWLGACAPSELAATQLVVTVDVDATLLARLRRVRATSYTTDATRAVEKAESHDFALASPTAGPEPGQVAVPFSFSVLRGAAPRVKLVVEGYDSLADDAPPLVEQKRVATFQPDAALHLRMQLDERCFALPNGCSQLDRTCWPGARACGPVPEAEVAPEASTGAADASTPTAACPEPNPCTPDYACTPTAPSGFVCVGQRTTWPVPLAGSRTEPKYDVRDRDVVVDEVTSLVWQRERPNRYEGCSGIHTVPGDRCTADEARIYCSRLRLAARSWRLPSKAELESLLDFGTGVPTIDRRVFPSADGAYWTASPLPRLATVASSVTRYWATDFRTASAQLLAPTLPLLVRCVSGIPPGQDRPEAQLVVDAAADTVQDRGTRLIWQRSESAPVEKFEGAVQHCTNLGAGWRLPHVKELLTVIDPTRIDPALDAVFSVPRSGLAWASPGDPKRVGAAWIVDMLLGASFLHSAAEVSRDARHAANTIPHARCVRNAGDLP